VANLLWCYGIWFLKTITSSSYNCRMGGAGNESNTIHNYTMLTYIFHTNIFNLINSGESLALNVIRMEQLIGIEQCYDIHHLDIIIFLWWWYWTSCPPVKLWIFTTFATELKESILWYIGIPFQMLKGNNSLLRSERRKEWREGGVPQPQLGHCQCPHPMRPCAMPSTTPRMRTTSPDTWASPSSTPPLATTSPNSVMSDNSTAPSPEE
jgi:hypothetical protein